VQHPEPPRASARPRRQLGFAAAGVLVAAADTYVVVVALPAIMDSVGIGIDHVQRATPIISGYLLGYVAVLPLLGRLSDQVGKRPVFAACLGAFAAGSVVTATSHTLSLLVAGRAIQGLGGGGLVPVTLALVAEHWPPERRGLPLGVVGALQELGSVVGPLYGAAVVALASWQWIFWLNLPLSAAVGIGFLASRRDEVVAAAPRRAALDGVGLVLLVAGAAAALLALDAPASLADGVSTGRLYAPVVAGPTWSVLSTPMALGAAALVVAFAVWEIAAPASVRPLLPLRHVPGALRRADLPGALLLAGILSCIVVAFSTTDPSTQVVASSTAVLAPVAVALGAALVWRQRRAAAPLLDPVALRARPAWGAMAVNLAVGAALMAALVDVPFFARATTQPDSQLGAALVLLRFLVAVPIGAVAGGALCRRPGREPLVAASGLGLAAIGFVTMASWPADALADEWRIVGIGLPFGASDVELVACGLGFGLAIAPINAAVLAAVPAARHGLATSLVVVARTVGMLMGISALTALALHRFYAATNRIQSPFRVCPTHPASCAPYERATTAALIGELHTVFAGAAGCAATGAALSLLLLRSRSGGERRSPAPEVPAAQR
jgi:MFS family permease